MKRVFAGRTIASLIGIALFFLAPALAAQEFHADLVHPDSPGKIWVKDGKYRIEPTDEPGFVIVDPEAKITRVFEVAEKRYFELPTDDFRCLQSDPFQLVAFLVPSCEEKAEGTEKVGGHACDKRVYTMNDSKFMTTWTAQDLGFMLKIVRHGSGKDETTALENIVVEAVPDSLFAPPEGFTKVEDPVEAEKQRRKELEEKEAALPNLATQGETTSPCYSRVGAGGELRVKVDPERSVKVYVYNRINETSELQVLPFRNGLQVESIGVDTWTLEGKGRSRNYDYNDSFFSGGAFTVDELRFVVSKGAIYASVAQSGKFRKDYFNPGNLQRGYDVSPQKAVKVEITGDNPIGTETKGAVLLHRVKDDAYEKVEFTVENGKQKVFEYPATETIDQVDVTIKLGDGAARIAVIQPHPREVDMQEVDLAVGDSEWDVDGDRGLTVTLTAGAEPVKGTLELERADRFSDRHEIDLAAGATKTWTSPLDKHVVLVKVTIASGTAKAKLDQTKK